MLTKEQNKILKTIFNSELKDFAAWGGGTALAEEYLHHRTSDDIDIILTDLPPTFTLTSVANKVKKALSAKKMKSFVKMNRFQYFYEADDGQNQKLEFVYYPFIKLEKPKRKGPVVIESLRDIAASKTLAGYQRNEPKDAFDLYVILTRKIFSLSQLITDVEKKFGEEIDAIMLLSHLTKSVEQFDELRPLILEKACQKDLINLFQKEFNKIQKN